MCVRLCHHQINYRDVVDIYGLPMYVLCIHSQSHLLPIRFAMCKQ